MENFVNDHTISNINKSNVKEETKIIHIKIIENAKVVEEENAKVVVEEENAKELNNDDYGDEGINDIFPSIKDDFDGERYTFFTLNLLKNLM